MRTLAFIRSLGSGAVGTVYLADMESGQGFRRQVAVKVLLADLDAVGDFLARMRDEARLLGLLQDDRIPAVLELVRVGGRDAVIMEYVDGVNIGTLLAAGHRVPPRALAELGADAAGALHRAHVAADPTTRAPLHVIHRDVKPTNIMLTPQGSVKLLDFGIARARFAAREAHTGQLLLGTLAYMAPEYIVTGDVTPAADVYGLGVSLWEAASGQVFGQPRIRRERFDARVEEALAAILDTHEPLIPILRHLLAWEPDERPPAAEVERAMRAVADDLRGPSLRTWAAQAVGAALTTLAEGQAPEDLAGLVGQTHPIDPPLDGSGLPALVPSGLPARGEPPPAAPPPVAPPPVSSRTVQPSPRPAPRSARRRRRSTLEMAIRSLLLGAGIGLLIVLVLAAILVITSR
jgi:eukaryotic-like serine/threonine-protein kinase